MREAGRADVWSCKVRGSRSEKSFKRHLRDPLGFNRVVFLRSGQVSARGRSISAGRSYDLGGDPVRFVMLARRVAD